MEKLSSSIVLAADDPAALAAFCAGLLQDEATPGLVQSHWRVSWPAGGQLQIYAPSRVRLQPHQGDLLVLCLQRSSEGRVAMAVLTAWLEVAAGLGAKLAEPNARNRSGWWPGC